MAEEQKRAITRARYAFKKGKTLPVPFRLQQLQNMLKMLTECSEEIIDALQEDLRKSRMESALYELEVLRADINALMRHLDTLTKGDSLPLNLLSLEDRAWIRRDPYGLVLVLGAWNYPFSLTLQPVAGAIAAGNVVIIKPSECAPRSAKLMAELVPRYLDTECYTVIEADLKGTIELLKNKFDYIFATGSTGMGKSVMAAAAQHLTPVTLELGGKSPVYIDESADIEVTTKRLLWGKWINLGQTCIAPDYIMCTKKTEIALIKEATKIMNEWYGKNWRNSTDLPRIINDKNFSRLKGILDRTEGKIVFGGETDEKERWISPTLIVGVTENDSTMEDEIFGPILPIMTVEDSDEAISFIVSRPKPLALYIFSKKQTSIEKFLTKTSSGGVCVNDVVWHNGYEGLPFGGVGNSGMGNYHGIFSFETFSHKKAVLQRGYSALAERLGSARYPPYNLKKQKFLTNVIRHIHSFNLTCGSFVSHVTSVLVGVGLVYGYQHFF